MTSEAGKGSDRRKEKTKKVEENLEQIDWTKRDKSKDSFVVRVNGKVISDENIRTSS